MKNALTSILARVHDASHRLRVTPTFKDDADADNDGEPADPDAAGAAAATADGPLDDGNGSSVAGEPSPAKRRFSGPVEEEDGSTARIVAAAVELFSGELLDAADELSRLQAQLDRQHEGCAHKFLTGYSTALAECKRWHKATDHINV